MKRILTLAIFTLFFVSSWGQSRRAVETSTDVAMFLPAAMGAVASFVEKDSKGFWQLAGSCAASVASAYAMKYSISKERPDGSDNHSFPSNHTGVAFAGATFIGERYGWKYAVPAYLVSGYVAWGRVYARRHDVWDVLAGAAIGTGCAVLVTSPLARENKIVLSPIFPKSGTWGVYAAMTF